MKSKFDLSGKIALITGGGGVLGSAHSAALAESGAAVAVADIKKDDADKVVQEITSSGGKAIAVEMDITDPEQATEAFDQVEKELGIVDILVNNAGINAPGFVLDIEYERFQKVMSVNVESYYMLSCEFAKRLKETDKPGSIINMASVLAYTVKAGSTCYAISKAAVAQLTRALALELGKLKIRVNAIAPGFIMSDLCRKYMQTEEGKRFIAAAPSGRMGEPEDLRGPLLLLASDEDGAWINGTVLTVDGGHGLV